MTPDRIKAIRERLGLSQAAFASRYGLNLRTLEAWERGGRALDQASSTLLLLIEREPLLIAEIIAAAYH